jgi:hypothetical protein
MVAFQWAIPWNIWTHGSWAFLRFQPCFEHALSHCLCNKFCPKLPKTAKICPKSMFSPFGFSIQEFFICLFFGQKMAFVCEFQHTPCRKWFFPQCSTPLVDMRFWGHVPTSLRNKNMERLIPYLFLKMVFWPSKLCWPFKAQWKKTFFQLWTLWSCKRWGMSVRFGGHVYIEVNYKIL